MTVVKLKKTQGLNETETLVHLDNSHSRPLKVYGDIGGGGGSDILKALIEGQTGLTIDIPEGATTIGSYDEETQTTFSLFYQNAQVEHVNVPESVRSIGDFAFCNCNSLTEITLPESLTSIGNEIFNGCSSLTSITLPESITSIGVEAFFNCNSLTEITLPESLTSIGDSAFGNCYSLTEITLPESLTSIGLSAFGNCNLLASVTVLSDTPPTLGDDAFWNTSSNLKIYVPASAVDTYKAATGWSTHANKIVAIQE